MAVLPGSLDYLYYNGILDHIPYEAYQYGFGNSNTYMMNPYSGLKQAYLNGSDYMNAAQRGLSYRTYTGDTYVQQDMTGYGGNRYDNSITYNPYGTQIGVDSNNNQRLNNKTLGDKIRYKIHKASMNFRESIVNTASSFKENVLDSSIWKGLDATALIIATPFS